MLSDVHPPLSRAVAGVCTNRSPAEFRVAGPPFAWIAAVCSSCPRSFASSCGKPGQISQDETNVAVSLAMRS